MNSDFTLKIVNSLNMESISPDSFFTFILSNLLCILFSIVDNIINSIVSCLFLFLFFVLFLPVCPTLTMPFLCSSAQLCPACGCGSGGPQQHSRERGG